MKFAFETILWGRRIENLDGVLDMIASFGYQGIELAQAPTEVFLREEDGSQRKLSDLGIQALRDKLLQHGRANGMHDGLTLVGLAGGSLRQRLDFCAPCPDLRPFLYIESFDVSHKDILDAVTADPPFVIALHPHWFKKVQRIEHAASEITRMVSTLQKELADNKWPEHAQRIEERGIRLEDQFKLLPDTAHLTIAGDLMPRSLPPGDRMAALHLKDWTSVYGRHSHRYAQGFVSLGQGEVPLKEILDSLRSFYGWVVVEQDQADQTKVRTLRDCTRWLIDWSPSGSSLRIPEKYRKESVNGPPHPAPHEQDEVKNELKFLQQVLPATTKGPRKFYQAVTDALLSLGGFITVQTFGWHPGKDDGFQNDELLRLGASGLPGTKPILKTSECLCGQVVRDYEIKVFNLRQTEHRRRFQDKALLERLEKRYEEAEAKPEHPLLMVSIPIFNISNPQHLRYVLNVFPEPSHHLDAAGIEEMERIGRHISRLADHVSDEICSAAFLKTCYLSRTAVGRQEYLDALRDMIRTEFDCRGITILLEDETGERLHIASTTGVVWREDIPEHQHYYTKGQGQTGFVWATGEIAMIADNRDYHEGENWGARSREVGSNAVCKECMYAPIGRPWSKPIGVIRVVDKRDPKDGCQATTMFTDDDAAVLDSIIQAALPQIEILVMQERQMKALTRMTHEFKYPLLAINGAVDLIRQELAAKGIQEDELLRQEYLTDILDWCQIMGHQAQNARIFAASPAGGLPLNPTRTLLRSEVIMPAVRHLRRFIKTEGIQEREIEIGDFSSIPPLHVDKGQMLQVALNLVSNAIKYRDRSRAFRLKIDGWQHGAAYIIEFSDYGMGVPYGLEDAVFEPGFRSHEARLRDISGQGIGLSVVQTVLKSHGGTIRLTKHSGPTTFQIALPERLRFPDWTRRSPLIQP